MFNHLEAPDESKKRYELYQKEAQILQVTSTENSIIVSIPALLPNFMSINMNEIQTMYYQLKSFRCNNTFNNVLSTDAIRIVISTQWIKTSNQQYGDPLLDDLTVVIPSIKSENEPIYLGLTAQPLNNDAFTPDFAVNILDFGSQQVDKLATAAELVDTINRALVQIGFEDGLEAPTVQYTTSDLNTIAFNAACQLDYDTAVGKMSLTFANTSPVKTWQKYPDQAQLHCQTSTTPLADQLFVNGGVTYMLSGVFVEIMTLETLPATQQKRISKLLGLQAGYKPSNFFGVDKTTLTTLPLYYASMAVAFNARTILAAGRKESFGTQSQPFFYTNASINSNALYSNSGNLEYYMKSYTDYMPRPMITSRYDQIFIHTSLNTNRWNQDGSQSDILEVIPILNDQLSMGVEYNHITRIYQVKDQNMRNFTLQLKDEDGQFITFNDHYDLQIAWFFTKE